MRKTSRFDCASSALTLKGLLGKTKRVFRISAAVGIAAHLSCTLFPGFESEQKAAKPLTTHFIKRQPRLTKPLELKKRPQPKRRQVQRKMVAVKARAQRDSRGVGFQPTQVLKGLARPSANIARIAGLAGVSAEPTSIADAIAGTREVEHKIDTALELLDIEALDTGQYHALVIQEPGDKRNIKGFCRLAVVRSEAMSGRIYGYGQTWFQLYIRPIVLNMAYGMNRFTDIDTKVMGGITLNSAELLKTPWVYALAAYGFRMSDAELEYLGEYLVRGGFVFADIHAASPDAHRSTDVALRDALAIHGVKAAFEKLPNDHPVYHSYFDFDGPPAGSDGIASSRSVSIIEYLDGLILGGRLAAILTMKGYYYLWSCTDTTPFGFKGDLHGMDASRQLQFGVNTIILALTQEGSITHRLMESVAY